MISLSIKCQPVFLRLCNRAARRILAGIGQSKKTTIHSKRAVRHRNFDQGTVPFNLASTSSSSHQHANHCLLLQRRLGFGQSEVYRDAPEGMCDTQPAPIK